MITPGAILASPTDAPVTVVHVDACVTLLVGDDLWTWPRRSAERVLSALGYEPAGEEDETLLAWRVAIARRRTNGGRIAQAVAHV